MNINIALNLTCNMEINLLLQTLNFIRPLSGKLQDRIAECLKEESYPKRYILLKEGDTNRKIYYIVDGLARNYYLNEPVGNVRPGSCSTEIL